MGHSTHPTFEITVNGQVTETTANTLQALLAEQGYGDTRVATAKNGAFVPASAREQTLVKRGDRIEVVSARQGG